MCDGIVTRNVVYINVSLSLSLSFSLSVFLSLSIRVSMFTTCVTLLLRIANHMATDSCCRGGIVHTRVGCSCSRLARPNSSTALWRFRASTSNSLIGLSRPPTNTPIRQIDHTYARQGIRVYEDDHFEPPMRQLPNSKALSLLRVSI